MSDPDGGNRPSETRERKGGGSGSSLFSFHIFYLLSGNSQVILYETAILSYFNCHFVSCILKSAAPSVEKAGKVRPERSGGSRKIVINISLFMPKFSKNLVKTSLRSGLA